MVPTDVQTASGFTYPTYQYSVKELVRPIDHGADSHGMPGIYFKYDVNALKVKVMQDREGLLTFLVRLCAGVGGLVATSGLVCGLIQALINFYCCGIRGKESAKMSPAASGKSADEKAGYKVADLILPGERVKSEQKKEQPGQSNGQSGLTLQQVERLIKS